MPTVEVYKEDKEKIRGMRKETPDGDRRFESFASVIHRLVELAEKSPEFAGVKPE